MGLIALAVFAPTLGGIASLLVRRPGRSVAVGCGVAFLLAVGPALKVLAASGEPLSYRAPWNVPYGSLALGVDPLSAFFLLLVLGLPALGAIYGAEYLHGHRSVRSASFHYGLLVSSMALVVLARNAVLFLMAWELMSVASFFLVTLDHERAEARRAGWLYLAAAHAGTACLLVLFVLLGREHGSLDFDRFTPAAGAATLFCLGLVGFGVKAGLVPFHIWLPEAHPAAPSHVSAVMSGVMIKTGIYGLLRLLVLVEPLPPWCGWLLIGAGVVSGLVGVVLALGQSDLKRLLAYSSVENVGIIVLALGLAEVGRSEGVPVLVAFGIAGALLHVLNHALFKGLLFLCAGALLHATGTADLERLGGLLRRMPRTGTGLLLGTLAICGLPPLNGFVGEFLIYTGTLHAIRARAVGAEVAAMLAMASLALIGGLAVATFTKAAGVALLGEPRSDRAAEAHEPGRAMRWAIYALAAGCVLVVLFARSVLAGLSPVIAQVGGLSQAALATALGDAGAALSAVSWAGVGIVALVGLLIGLRRRLLATRVVTAGPTWDCGYVATTPRMQYTASSFAQPLLGIFDVIARPTREGIPVRGLFPGAARFASATPDVIRERLYEPLFARLFSGLGVLRRLQEGRVQLYVLYIGLTLLALIVWLVASS